MGITSSSIKIVNDTNTDIIKTSVSGIDSFDFVDTNHPNYKLSGLSIGSKRSVERIVDLYSPASHCPVTVTLIFKDKTEDTFRIDLKYAVGCCARFNHSRKSHNMSYKCDNKTIVITIENTAQQKRNEEAEELLKKAKEAMRQRMYEVALERLDRAKTLANRADTVKDIRSEESEVYSSYGESIFDDGIEMEKKERFSAAGRTFERAKDFFQQSLDLVYSRKTQEKIHLSDLKISGNESLGTAMELEEQAFELVENEEYQMGLNKYEAALAKYKEAIRTFAEGAVYRNEYFSNSVEATQEKINNVEVAIENTGETKRNEEAKELMREAKEATNQHLYDFALERLGRAKSLAVRTKTIENVKNEESRVCSLYGEAVFQEGLEWEKKGHSERAQSKFARAQSLFQRALKLVSSRENRQKVHLIKLKISGNTSFAQAMELKHETLRMVENKKYEMALNKYDAALNKCKEAKEKYVEGGRCRKEYFSNSVKNIDEQIEKITIAIKEQQQDEEAKELIKKAKEAKRQHLHDSALKHLGQAETLANQAETIKTIKNEESQVCSLYGDKSFEEGLDLEKRGDAEKAQSKFDEARTLFQRARDLVSSEETQKKSHLVELKISGNRNFNKALNLEDEASLNVEHGQNNEALSKYDAALAKYKEARVDYVEGAVHKEEYFADSVKIVDEQIEQVTVVVNDINNVQTLQDGISGLRIDNKTVETTDDGKEEVESHLQHRFIQH